MNPRWKKIVAAVTATALAAAGCAAPADDDPIVLTFADGFSATHPIGKGGAQPFLEHLRENGPAVGLEVDYFPSGQLGTQKDVIHFLRSGTIDIGAVIPAYLANQIPLSSVAELPGLVEDPCAASAALVPMMQPGGILYEEELHAQGVMPIWGVMIPGYEVFTNGVDLARPDDLDGELIRSPGGVGDRLVSELGASAVSMPAPDLYEAVARNTVSGAVLPPISIASYSLEEVMTNSTLGANLLTTTVMYGVSSDTWEELNDEQRTLIREASEIAQVGGCESLQEASLSATEKIRAGGVEMTEIEGAAAEAWSAALTPIRRSWVDDLESVGLPAGEVLADFESRMTEEKR